MALVREVIADPDLAERMPWLVERPFERLPGMLRSALRTFSFDARLEEDDGTVIVRAFSGRIGRLSATDAEAYLPHIRSARAQGKVVAALASGRITGPRSPFPKRHGRPGSRVHERSGGPAGW